MSSGDLPRKGGGWRQGGKPNDGGRQSPGPGGPAWRRVESSSGPVVTRRGTKLAIGVGGLVGLVLLLIVLLIMLRPQPPASFFLIGADYAESLAVPHNVHGWQALEELQRWVLDQQQQYGSRWMQILFGSRHVSTPRSQVAEFTADGLDQLAEDLRKVGRGAAVVVVSALAAVDSDGVYFIPGRLKTDGTLLDPGVRLRLSDLTKRLRGFLPEGQDKLLVLDLAPLPFWTPLGLFHNDVAGSLRTDFAKIQANPETRVNRLLVLAGADYDDRTWSSDELRRSAFLHVFMQGVMGGAKDEGNINPGHISVAKLFDYVKREVQVWSQDNRHDIQRPMLLCGAADESSAALHPEAKARATAYYIQFTQKAPDAKTPAAPSPEALAQVLKLWHEWKTLEQGVPPPWTYQPERWRLATAWLLRYEQLVLAGSGSADAVSKHLEQAFTGLRPTSEVRTALNASLAAPAALRIWGPTPAELEKEDREDRARIDRLLGEWGTEAWETHWKTVEQEIKGHESRFFVRLQRALADRLTRTDANRQAAVLQQTAGLLQRLRRWETLPVETQVLRLIHAYDLRDKQAFDPALIKLVIDTEVAASTVAWGWRGDGRHGAVERWFQAVQPAMAEADQQRRLGLDAFFAGQDDRARDALQKAQDQYRRLLEEQVRPLAEAFEIRDELFSKLPFISQWVNGPRDFADANPDTPQYQEQLDRANQAAIALWEMVHRLAADLNELAVPARNEAAAQRRERLVQVRGRAREAKEKLDQLLDAARAEADRLAGQARERGRSQSDWQALDNLLQLPFFDVARRERLLQKRREIGSNLLSAQGGRELQLKRDETILRAAAFRRARLALAELGPEASELFRAAAIDGSMAQRLEAASLEKEHWQSKLIQAVGGAGKLRNIWHTHLQKQTEAGRKVDDVAQARGPLLASDLMARQLHPASLPARATAPTVADELRRFETAQLLLWQAERFIDDYWADGDREPKELPYFARMAGALLEDAGKLTLPQGVTDRSAMVGRFKRVRELEELVQSRQNARLAYSLTGLKPDEPLRWTSESFRTLGYDVAVDRGLPLGLPHVRLSSRASRPWLRIDDAGRAFDLSARTAPPPFRVDREESQRGQGDETEELRLAGWFRGHRQSTRTEVLLYPEPDIQWTDRVSAGPGLFSIRATPAVA
ncbi:MAG TPA: hypothetical protein PKC45_12650, partial [Gemmatales bacterium]|nr:hypothetical protein [Gemmatales bacterium]